MLLIAAISSSPHAVCWGGIFAMKIFMWAVVSLLWEDSAENLRRWWYSALLIDLLICCQLSPAEETRNPQQVELGELMVNHNAQAGHLINC